MQENNKFNHETKYFLDKAQTWAKNKKIPLCPALFIWTVIKDEIKLAISGLDEDEITLVIAGLNEMNVDIEILEAVLDEHINDLPKGTPTPDPEMIAAMERATAIEKFPPLDVLFIECLRDPSLGEILMNNAISPKDLREAIDFVLESVEDNLGGEMVTVGGHAPQMKKQEHMGFLEVMGKTPAKVFGRDREIEEITKILMHRIKKNPILLGEPGVGKTAIVEAIAYTSDKDFYCLNVNAMVSGTIFRGQFEERMEKTVKFLKDNPNAVLFIDEAHTIANAGNSSGDVNLMNVLKPAMARGEIQVVLSTTLGEYRLIERDSAFVRRCHKVFIGEPSEKETLAILKGSIGQFEAHHGIRYSQGALETLVEYASGLMGVYFPDKAFDLVDSIGASAAFDSSNAPSPLDADIAKNTAKRSLIATSGDYSGAQALILEHKLLMQKKTKQKKIYQLVDEEFTSNWIRTRDPNFRKPLDASVAEKLKVEVVGQDSTIDAIVEDFSLRQLDSEGYPTSGNYLFMGNTSVGKTALAKEIAKEIFNGNIFIIDATEYQDRYSVHKLIGADPGLIGYEDGGKLIEFLKTHPNGVILVDEVEKGHESLHDLLLQMTGDGRITDNKGFEANLQKFMVIMTSNSTTAPTPMGYGAQRPKRSHPKILKPEFMSRIDMVFEFQDLQREHMEKIYEGMLNGLSERIYQKYGFHLEDFPHIREEVLGESQNPRELKTNFRKAKRKMLTKILTPHASPPLRQMP